MGLLQPDRGEYGTFSTPKTQGVKLIITHILDRYCIQKWRSKALVSIIASQEYPAMEEEHVHRYLEETLRRYFRRVK